MPREGVGEVEEEGWGREAGLRNTLLCSTPRSRRAPLRASRPGPPESVTPRACRRARRPPAPAP